MKLRILSGDDIDKALGMPQAIEICGRAFMELSSGQAVMPARMHLDTPGGTTLVKPAYLQRSRGLAMKLVTVFPQNPPKGLPTIQALVMVLDSETGTPSAIMDGTRLTALRTGAASGAASKLLARPESKVLALFGAGGTAPDQAEAVMAVRPIEELRIYTPSGDSSAALAADLKQKHPGLKAFAAQSPAQAVQGADVICCATTSTGPVFDPADVKPGAHINGVGSFKPEMKEVPLSGLANVRVYVDSLESAITEAGEVMAALEAGALSKEDLIELGAALNGDAPGRASEQEITVFKSVGTAVQDVATAQAVLEKAHELGLGTQAEL